MKSIRDDETMGSKVSPPQHLPSKEPVSQSDALMPSETTPLLSKVNHEKPPITHYRDVISGPRFHFLFWSLMFGCTIAFFDTTMMASSHPVITSYFNASNAASWLSTVFYLTSTVFQPIYGRVGDTIGRRPVLLFAVTVFLLSTTWCGLASDIGQFIAARALTGLGAGGVSGSATILTSDLVKIEYRSIYQSYFNIAYGAGHGSGAALGGFLCDKLGWRAAFFVQLPFIATFGILAFIACPDDLGPNLAKTQGKTIREAFGSYDFAGTFAVLLTVSGLILGVNLGGNIFSWTHPIVISSLTIAALSSMALVVVERRAERPVLPLKLFSTTPVANVIGSNFFASMTTATIVFNAPLFLQAAKQTSPTTSGLILVPALAGAAVTAVLAGVYITYTRRLKPPLALGAVAGIGGAVTVACLSAETPIRVVPWMVPWASIGQGFFFPAASIAVLALNSQEDQAVANTTLNLVRNLGSILGVALSSWILQNALPVYLEKYVTEPDPTDKAHIIRLARESIQFIRTLDPMHKQEVIEAYAISLRATFIFAVVSAMFTALLILPAHLPRVQKQSDMDELEDSTENEEVQDGADLPIDEADDDDGERPLLATRTNSSARINAADTDRSRRPPMITRRTSYDPGL